uniref:Uncharacterized protein n=1 Tax=Arundo donax TaxID=35708 RepID=A0A0A9AUK8_ARUDO
MSFMYSATTTATSTRFTKCEVNPQWWYQPQTTCYTSTELQPASCNGCRYCIQGQPRDWRGAHGHGSGL